MSTTVEHNTRAEQVANLRAFADFLEANPQLKSPFDASGERFLVCLNWTGDPKAELAAWARATSHLTPVKDYGDTYAGITIDFGGIEVYVYAGREQVCERVVTGVETVTKTVKDPEALAAVPEVEVTEQIEQVEWICRPLLEPSTADSASSPFFPRDFDKPVSA